MKAWPWLGVLLLTTMLAVAACSGADATPTASPIPTPVYHRPSPTTAAPTFSPTPLPTPNPSDLAIRPCRAEDLAIEVGRSSGATGNIILGFGVRDVSDEICRVHGAPSLELRDAGGNIVQSGKACTSIMSNDNCPNLVAVLDPDAPVAADAGPYIASFNISWLEPAFFGETCAGETTTLAIDLPDGGGRIELGDVGIPDCARPGTSEFVLAPTPTPTPDPTIGFR